MEQHFRIGRKSFILWDVTGTVKRVDIFPAGKTNSHPKREVWLVREDTGKDQLVTIRADFPVMEGQKLTAVLLECGNQNQLVYVYNDSLGTSQLLLRGAMFMAKYRTDYGCCLALGFPPVLAALLYGVHATMGQDRESPWFQTLHPWWYVVPGGLMAAMIALNAWRRRKERLRYQEELAKFLNTMNAAYNARAEAGS